MASWYTWQTSAHNSWHVLPPVRMGAWAIFGVEVHGPAKFECCNHSLVQRLNNWSHIWWKKQDIDMGEHENIKTIYNFLDLNMNIMVSYIIHDNVNPFVFQCHLAVLAPHPMRRNFTILLCWTIRIIVHCIVWIKFSRKAFGTWWFVNENKLQSLLACDINAKPGCDTILLFLISFSLPNIQSLARRGSIIQTCLIKTEAFL